tara:strand:- start:3953 stop:4465 length:513 start_codon:yes stop_codon:yes gene_type:complete
MFGFLKKIGSAIHHTATAVGKKVAHATSTAISVGKKVAGSVGTIASKVSNVSDAVAKGLAVAGGVAGAVGLEPLAGVLEAGAGASKVISEASKGVGAVAGDVNKGLNTATNVAGTVSKIGSAVASGDFKKGLAQAPALVKGVQDLKTSAQTTTRNAIQRGKNVQQQLKAS